MGHGNCSILISGIGIAGPTLAYWLQRFGFEVMLENLRKRLSH
jgi:2-polyprenyl-6-methoxyphenol hydroxylase-like FAD-dependent oxidoreductase